MQNQDKQETNLDPQDWEAMRALGHRMVDDALLYLQQIREKPVWQPISRETRDFFAQSVPHSPAGEEQAYQDFKDYILSNPMGNIHPRFWGWVMGNGIPYAALAEMLAATVNPNMGGGDHVANYVERQVIDWCKEMVGFPADSSGILVSGGSMANFIGLAVARNAMAGFDIRAEGISAAPRQMTVYTSTETHSSNYKAIEQLGLGKKWMRFIPVNGHNEIDIQKLEKKLLEDKASGYQPICIIGNAGTTNTGAIDDLNTLADICQREKIWFHVDGAFGALVALSDQYKSLVAGMERADSLAFDLHKWMYMPFEVACVLIREFKDHVDTFSASPDYLAHLPRGLAGGQHAWFGDLGLQLTRGFRALKVWMTLKAYGLDHFRRQIEQDIEHAKYLAGLVSNHPDLELLDHVPLNIVCFRYIVPGMNITDLNELNQEILMRLHERGLAVPSYTRLNGKFALRVSITNHRSTRRDFEFLVAKVVEIAEEVVAEKTGMNRTEVSSPS
jgi:glutamate/tyrosine decarboxylase-like PLP-dependent enzyme